MKRFPLFLSLLIVPVMLGCVSQEETETSPPPVQEEAPAPALEEEDLVTKNVTYTGILEQGGVTIYQEGSHRLMLSDGKLVLLTTFPGQPISLDLYTGKLVRVNGDVKPTVEVGGTIMEVKEIFWIRRERDENGKESEVLRVLCGGGTEAVCPAGFTCSLEEEGAGICVEGSSSSSSSSSVTSESSSSSSSSSSISPSSESSVSSVASESSNSSQSVSSESSASSATSDHYQQALALMLEEDYSTDRWTQEYCSSHVGFCVAVHKNWYFKSFGAMTSVLWHVEIGAENVDAMGDGPIFVELKSGTIDGLGVGDGDVKEVGNRVIGYRAWTESRHFEISSPKELREPVMFITQSLKSTVSE